MTFEGLGEMFEGESADTNAGNFLLTSIGGRAEGLACKDLVARTLIGVSGNYSGFSFFSLSPPLFKTPEGFVVGFRNFAWAPN